MGGVEQAAGGRQEVKGGAGQGGPSELRPEQVLAQPALMRVLAKTLECARKLPEFKSQLCCLLA